MTETSAVDTSLEAVDEVDEAALAEVMRIVPLGAGILAGGALHSWCSVTSLFIC